MLKREFDRKIIHIFSAAVPLFFYLFPKPILLSLLLPGTALYLFVDYTRRFYPALNKLFIFIVGPAMRRVEEKEFKITGASWQLLSFSLVLLLFPLDIAIVSCLLLTWSDALAALVGIRWGKHKWYGNHSLEGSAAFMISGMLIFSIGFPQFPLMWAVIVVSITTLAEGMLHTLDDNILIPLLSAVTLVFLASI